jgi:hypothetical protein
MFQIIYWIEDDLSLLGGYFAQRKIEGNIHGLAGRPWSNILKITAK